MTDRLVLPAPSHLVALSGTRLLAVQMLAVAGAVIAGFFYFERIVGLVPCEICLAERWPWYGAAALAAVLTAAPLLGLRAAAFLFVLIFIGSAGIGIYHVMVEQHLISGPTACTSSHVAHESLAELKARLLATKPVHCDEIQWQLAGISLAGWNVVASLGAAVLAGWRLRRA